MPDDGTRYPTLAERNGLCAHRVGTLAPVVRPQLHISWMIQNVTSGGLSIASCRERKRCTASNCDGVDARSATTQIAVGPLRLWTPPKGQAHRQGRCVARCAACGTLAHTSHHWKLASELRVCAVRIINKTAHSQMNMISWYPPIAFCSLSPVTMLRHMKPPPPFRSRAQARQDMCVASLFDNMTNGYYVDLASNDATYMSNTYLLDRVLSWRGVCIEPQRRYLEGYVNHRTCALVSSIISPERGVNFVESANGGFSGIRRRAARGAQNMSATARLDVVFRATDVPSVIDYMSLDIEGYEEIAMSTFPFDTHSMKLMTVERPGENLHRNLVHRGMCVSHNGAPWIDLMYLNRTLWHTPIPMPTACAVQKDVPKYVRAADLCRS